MRESVLGLDLWAVSARLFTSDDIVRKDVDPGQAHGWLHLPSVAGGRNTVTPADNFGVAGVTSVFMKTPVEAVMGGMLESSAAGIGAATVSGPAKEACRQVTDRVVEKDLEIHKERR